MMLLTVVAVLLTITTDFADSSCVATCRFQLCNPSSISLSSKSDVPLTSPICLQARRLGVVHTAESLVRNSAGAFTPISVYTPPALLQSFSPHFFKIYRKGSHSAIGHEVPQRNQALFLNGVCIALPIVRYQLLDSRGRVDRNVATAARQLRDCVAFKVILKPATAAPPTVTLNSVTTAPKDISSTRTTQPLTTTTRSSTTTSTQRSTLAITTTPAVTVTVTNGTSPTSVTTAPKSTATETDTTAVGTVPPVVDIDDTVLFPPSTKLNEAVSFKVQVSVSSGSGSTKEDFFLLSDGTSSMVTAIDTAKERFHEVVQNRRNVSSNVAFGVGYYRDENEPDAYTNVQPITRKFSLVQNAIDSLTASSNALLNRDVPEGGLNALYHVATKPAIGWRPDSRRILVFFGDAPGHEPTCVGGVRLTRQKVIAALKKEKISAVAVSFKGSIFSSSPGLDAATTSYECFSTARDTTGYQASNITAATGGVVVEAEEQTALIDTVLSLVGGLSQDLEADVSDCEMKNVDVTFEPPLPITIGAGKAVTVTETVRIDNGVCSAPGSAFSCKVIFSLSGALAGVQTLKAPSVSGC